MSGIICKYINILDRLTLQRLTLYRVIIFFCFIAWLYLAFGEGHEAHHHHDPSAGTHNENNDHEHHIMHHNSLTLSDYLVFWPIMTIAMMMPIALPMISGYTDIFHAAKNKGTPIALPIWLLIGYMTVWLAFALIMAPTSFFLADYLKHYDTNTVLAIALLLTGFYQLTPIKNNCLEKCRTPMTFFIGHWKFTTKGVLSLGINRGLYCLVCCIALMCIMVLSATHHIMAMVGLTLIMYGERVVPHPHIFNKVTGIIFFSLALLVFVL